MYNRYVPQSDGSFQRNRIPDQPAPPPPPQAVLPHPPTHPPVIPENEGPFGFLKQLLPQGFDFGDLAILFLLLLMAGDDQEEQNNAILTLALYLFM